MVTATHSSAVAIAITPITLTAEVRSATQPQPSRVKMPTASAIENRLAARWTPSPTPVTRKVTKKLVNTNCAMDSVAAVSISQRMCGSAKISRMGAARSRMAPITPPRPPARRSTSSTLRNGCIASASAKQPPATA